MGQYAIMTIMPRSFREDADLDVDALVAAMCRDQADGEGYHPAGTAPRVDWYKISQQEVDFELAAQRSAGIKRPAVPYRAGDWRVRVVIDVTEDEELPRESSSTTAPPSG